MVYEFFYLVFKSGLKLSAFNSLNSFIKKYDYKNDQQQGNYNKGERHSVFSYLHVSPHNKNFYRCNLNPEVWIIQILRLTMSGQPADKNLTRLETTFLGHLWI